ncbi:MAG: F0F1 ATP synthase subunit alpha, partial [Oscillospiraceae bacterium]|nr:F0F1 ATP synthase subunit alpha [Oscillospiraceae bacterium]
KQANNSPVEVAHQVCILFAVTKGFLKDVPVDRIPRFETRLYEFMDNRHMDILEAIRTTGKLEDETAAALEQALTELLQEFVA